MSENKQERLTMPADSPPGFIRVDDEFISVRHIVACTLAVDRRLCHITVQGLPDKVLYLGTIAQLDQAICRALDAGNEGAMKRFAGFCVAHLTEDEMGPVRKAVCLFLETLRRENS